MYIHLLPLPAATRGLAPRTGDPVCGCVYVCISNCLCMFMYVYMNNYKYTYNSVYIYI